MSQPAMSQPVVNAAFEQKKYTVAEFFCGCGGFSHGFVRSGRFNAVLGNDIKKAALRTFEFNHSRHGFTPKILEGDIRTISIESIVRTLDDKGVGIGELDCLIGGPPCQGFSQMRRSEERKDDAIVSFKGYNRLDQDPRNDLVLRFLEIANALRPKFILIENVPQMLTHGHNGQPGGLARDVETLLRELEYDVAVDVLNAADYGVPQLRERAFFVACRIGNATLPAPTHVGLDLAGGLPFGLKPWVTVADAISDLPTPPEHVDTFGGGPLDNYLNIELSDYGRAMRSDECFPYNHVTRNYQGRIIDTIKQMLPGETWDHASERMRSHYEKLIEEVSISGDSRDAVKKMLIEQKIINPIFYRKYYWSAYTRLSPSRPALTITANSNFLGSGRFTHPSQDRGITMREAARLQSFDDDFRLVTSATDSTVTNTIGVGMDMIGEAVPPLLGRSFAQLIAAQLDAEADSADVKLAAHVSAHR
ncbi:MAG TPA: DNA cytosine methyltransferase [Pyrinomonadaceae bacterium]